MVARRHGARRLGRDSADEGGQQLDGDGEHDDAEDGEELVPERLAFGLFPRFAGPFPAEGDGVMADFVPGDGHVNGLSRERVTQKLVALPLEHLVVFHAAGRKIYQRDRDDFVALQPAAAEKAGLKDADTFTDYRKLLERGDIDAVVIATHDPWHAPISIDAMNAGKHVYCEKPMTRYLDEAFKVHDAVKKTGKIFTVGSQGCSAGAWHKAAELITAGKIGQLVWGQGFYCRNNPKGEWNYPIEKESTPENMVISFGWTLMPTGVKTLPISNL